MFYASLLVSVSVKQINQSSKARNMPWKSKSSPPLDEIQSSSGPKFWLQDKLFYCTTLVIPCIVFVCSWPQVWLLEMRYSTA